MKRQYSCVEDDCHRSSDSCTISSAAGQNKVEDSNTPPPPNPTDSTNIRRPKGRPLGSKNKPKPPTNPSDHPLMPSPYYVLQVPQGADIVRLTTHFCQQRNIGLCILNAKGAVSNVNFRQPPTVPGNIGTFFCGPYDVVSISATIFPADVDGGTSSFSISVAGQHGQVFGGLVIGPLVAATPMQLFAVMFSRPSYHVLQHPHHQEDVINAVADGGGGHNQSSLPAVCGGGAGLIGTQQSMLTLFAARQLHPPPY